MSFKDTSIDFSDSRETAIFVNAVKSLEGVHRVNIIKFRPRRSDRQNRYYWPCFVQPFADFLRAQGEGITDEEVHELMKAKFLRRPVPDRRTGEIIGQAIASTTQLTTAEFNLYLDQLAAWLWNMFGIVVPDPIEYHEKEEENSCKNRDSN